MLEREAKIILSERVKIDACIGGERTGDKVGRGAEGKTPFVAAVQTDWDDRPQRIVLHEVSGFANEQINAFEKKKLKPTVEISTHHEHALADDQVGSALHHSLHLPKSYHCRCVQ